jgi:hypothetical protein
MLKMINDDDLAIQRMEDEGGLVSIESEEPKILIQLPRAKKTLKISKISAWQESDDESEESLDEK